MRPDLNYEHSINNAQLLIYIDIEEVNKMMMKILSKQKMILCSMM
jgi:hypothetical protein